MILPVIPSLCISKEWPRCSLKWTIRQPWSSPPQSAQVQIQLLERHHVLTLPRRRRRPSTHAMAAPDPPDDLRTTRTSPETKCPSQNAVICNIDVSLPYKFLTEETTYSGRHLLERRNRTDLNRAPTLNEALCSSRGISASRASHLRSLSPRST